MPASPDIYRPFDFEYIFDQPKWQADENALSAFTRRNIRLEEAPKRLADWMNRWLERRFQVYARRDGAYMEMLQAELDSENGQVTGWFDAAGDLKALRAEWGLEKREQRFLYCEENAWATEEKPARPAIMARVTNAEALVRPVRLNGDCPCDTMEVFLKLEDKLIPGNHGLWLWTIGRDGSSLSKMAGKPDGDPEAGDGQNYGGVHVLRSTEVLKMTPGQFAAWIFGYQKPEELLEEFPPFWCSYIETLNGVFLDEVV
jgi:hypothetical protein